MAEDSAKRPSQQGVEESLLDCYYDIMVMGKTGSGKTTTVEKLLIANLPRQEQPTQQQAAKLEPADGEHEPSKNFCMWLVTDDEKMSKRLKHLDFCSCQLNPHEHVNFTHEQADHVSTTSCELLSNEVTKVRVLDVPGFFGVDVDEDISDPGSYIHQGTEADLAIVRKILRIKSAHNLKFKRIIYFLPVRGPLVNADRILITELGIMKKYFGRPIFESMVVVATIYMPPGIYKSIEDKGQDLFPELHQTRRHFKVALKKIFESEDIPEPPIVFISLIDSCEKILEKIQKAEVKQDSLNLELPRYLCARCDVHIISEGARGANVFSCALPEQVEPISAEESRCHPMMIPKYSEVKKFLGGIAHLITFRQFVGKWPNFENMDEVCINCKGPPKIRGCMRVGEEYRCGEESFTVAHSASALERYEIEVKDDEGEDQAEDPHQDEAMQGAPSEQQGTPNVSQDGREASGQELDASSMYASGDMKG